MTSGGSHGTGDANGLPLTRRLALRARHLAPRLALSAAAMLVMLALLEVMLRLATPAAFPLPSRHYALRPLLHLEMSPLASLMPGVEGVARFETNADGMRALPKDTSPGTLRILAVGGSTTECLYLDQAESWPMVVETLLGEGAPPRAAWVGNVGRSGLTSAEHVATLQGLLPEHEDVDVVLILMGINDAALVLADGEGFAPSRIDPTARPGRTRSRAFWARPRPGLRHLYVASAARVGAAALASLDTPSQDPQGLIYERWRQGRRDAKVFLDAMPPGLEGALEQYRRNVVAMKAAADAQGVRLVFMTQPAIWREDLPDDVLRLLWFGWRGRSPTAGAKAGAYYTLGVLRGTLDAFNDTLRAACVENGVPCIDVARAMDGEPSYFYDDVHFSEAGSRRVAALVAEALSAP